MTKLFIYSPIIFVIGVAIVAALVEWQHNRTLKEQRRGQ